jgi:hypothetical protein
MPVSGRAAAIEPMIDAVAAIVAPFGGDVMAAPFRTVRRAIEMPIHAIAAPIQAVLDAIAAGVETPLDAVAPIRRRRILRPSLRRAKQQSDTDPHTIALHIPSSLDLMSHTRGSQRRSRKGVDRAL